MQGNLEEIIQDTKKKMQEGKSGRIPIEDIKSYMK